MPIWNVCCWKTVLSSGTYGDSICIRNDEGDDFIEYDSLINIRSWQNNPTRGVSDPAIRESIKQIVERFIKG